MQPIHFLHPLSVRRASLSKGGRRLDYQILTLRKVCAAWPRTSICQCARPSISHYDHSSIFSQLPPQYFSRWPSYFSQRPHNYLSQVSVLCTGRPRKNFLSEFAQNCPNCPDLPRTAQKSPKLPRIAQNAQNCPKCPELPRLVFRYVLLKHSERKFFSGTPCTLRIYADDKHHSNNQRYTNVLQQISVSMI